MPRTLAIGLIGGTLMVAFTAGMAFADTCSDRQKVCFAYCERQYNGSPACLDACRRYLSECLQTGCWESKVTAKRCGFTQQ